MNINRFNSAVALLAATLAFNTGHAATSQALDEAMSHDGLAKIKVKDVDLAYARPGATFDGYGRIRLEPIEVAFSKSWDAKKPGSNFKVSADEMNNIRKGVAEIVNEEFVKELQSKSSYKIVNESGPDVLRVKINIVNLYVNAPDVTSPGMTRTFTASAGEMTMIMELYDSETGQVLARVVDRKEGRSAGGAISYSNRVTNTAEARDIASSWARALRKGLDRAHGIGKK